MIKKFSTLLCIMIVVLGILEYYYESSYIVMVMLIIFLIFLGLSMYEAIKSKAKIQIMGLIILIIVFGIIILNYYKII